MWCFVYINEVFPDEERLLIDSSESTGVDLSLVLEQAVYLVGHLAEQWMYFELC